MITINDYGEFIAAINNHDVCLVKIGAEWCGQCKVVQKNIEDIEKLHSDVYFINVDADEAEDIIEKFNIRNIPVTIVIKKGQVDSKVIGIQSQAELESRL